PARPGGRARAAALSGPAVPGGGPGRRGRSAPAGRATILVRPGIGRGRPREFAPAGRPPSPAPARRGGPPGERRRPPQTVRSQSGPTDFLTERRRLPTPAGRLRRPAAARRPEPAAAPPVAGRTGRTGDNRRP